MAKSIKKGPYVDERLMKKVGKLRQGDNAVIKTWSRSCTISPEMVGFTFGVHNGKEHIPIKATEDMVGHKLGEFVPTTKFGRHGGRMQKELEKKQAESEAIKAAPAAVAVPAKSPAKQK